MLTDGATYRLAGRGVGFAEVGQHALKGKAEPQRLWRVTRVLSAFDGVQRVDGLEAPLTGRDAELRTIKELFTPRRIAYPPPGAGVWPARSR